MQGAKELTFFLCQAVVNKWLIETSIHTYETQKFRIPEIHFGKVKTGTYQSCSRMYVQVQRRKSNTPLLLRTLACMLYACTTSTTLAD